MNKWHKTLTLDKWTKFSSKEQFLMIATEILRAQNWSSHQDISAVLESYERALELIDLTVVDTRLNSQQRRRLLQIREALGFLYSKELADPALCQVFYNELTSFFS